MRRFLVGTCVALAGAAAAAQQDELRPNDFANGLRITPPRGAPFFRVDLPEVVYTSTAWPDLRDIRLFNAAGERVPFARITPPADPAEEHRTALQSFRLEVLAPGAAPLVQLETQDSGVALRVLRAGEPATAAEYILATPDVQEAAAIQRLDLRWEDRADNWQQHVSAWASLDLEDWHPAATNSPVLDLKTDDGQRLRHSTVPVRLRDIARVRYWRLRFPEGRAPTLTGVDVVSRTAPPAAPGVMLSVPGTMTPEGVVYRVGSRQSVGRIRITLSEPNSVLPLNIEGRLGSGDTWRSMGRTVAYRLNRDDGSGEQRSPAVATAAMVVDEIRLRGVGAPLTRVPEFAIERTPVSLIVNARGPGPFLLAWGSRAITEDVALPIATLVPGYRPATGLNVPYGALAESVDTLGGPARLTELSLAERRSRTTMLLVWSGLIVGAAALAWLAFRIYRDSASPPQ